MFCFRYIIFHRIWICFAYVLLCLFCLLCVLYHFPFGMKYLTISFGVAALALEQSYDHPSGNEIAQNNIISKTHRNQTKLSQNNKILYPWWCHEMETFSALLAICAGNSPVPAEFPAQRPVTRSFAVFFDLCLNKRLWKQSRGGWFETLSHPLWRHRNDLHNYWDVLYASLLGWWSTTHCWSSNNGTTY